MVLPATNHIPGSTMMKVKFTSDDRFAIDLLLQHHGEGPSTAWGQSYVAKPHDHRLLQQVQRVEKVLGMLAQLPATDPPANLVSRTLKRVEREGTRRPAQMPSHVQHAPPQRPANRQVH